MVQNRYKPRVSEGLRRTAMKWIEWEAQAGLFVAAVASILALLQ